MRATKKQVDEIIKLIAILNSPSVLEEHKMDAERKLRAIKDDVTQHEYGVSKDRIPDVQYLERILKNPFSSSQQKLEAKIAIEKIVKEDSLVKGMRKSLIKEVRAGNAGNVRDISEYVIKHSKYQ
jgi:hypothetical protein